MHYCGAYSQDATRIGRVSQCLAPDLVRIHAGFGNPLFWFVYCIGFPNV